MLVVGTLQEELFGAIVTAVVGLEGTVRGDNGADLHGLMTGVGVMFAELLEGLFKLDKLDGVSSTFATTWLLLMTEQLSTLLTLLFASPFVICWGRRWFADWVFVYTGRTHWVVRVRWFT